MFLRLSVALLVVGTSLSAAKATVFDHLQAHLRTYQDSSILNSRGGSSGHSVIRTHDVHQVDKKMDAAASRVRSKLVSGRIKAFLSILCGLSIAIELGEELFENIPILKHFHHHVHLAHGVLLLTLSHLLHTLFELIDEIEKHSEIKEQRLKFEEVCYYTRFKTCNLNPSLSLGF